MALHCSRGDHIGLHRLIFFGLLVIVPIVIVFSLPGGLVGTIGVLGRFMQSH